MTCIENYLSGARINSADISVALNYDCIYVCMYAVTLQECNVFNTCTHHEGLCSFISTHGAGVILHNRKFSRGPIFTDDHLTELETEPAK